MIAFSTCWNTHRHNDGQAIAEEVLKLGFDSIEISHGTRLTLMEGFFRAVDQNVIKVSSVHHPCPSPIEILQDAPDVYEFSDSLQLNRNRAIKLAEQSLETAARVGASRMVVHLGSVPMKPITTDLEYLALSGKQFGRDYIAAKLELVRQRQALASAPFDRALKAIEALLPLSEKVGVKIGIETRSHFEQIPTFAEFETLMDHFKDSPWVGTWHDFGHVQRQANLGLLNHEEALRAIAPNLVGCHIHDVGWPHRDHRVPFSSNGVDFPALLPLVPLNVPLIWEISRSQPKEAIVKARDEWMRQFGDRDTVYLPSATAIATP